MVSDKRLLQVLQGKTLSRPPVWMMRQAGRYLSEYREIRATAPSFIDFCYTPKLAAEATLQPIRRFGFDAAILFSDILVIADALGQKVSFETGEGPRLTPIQNMTDLNALHAEVDLSRLNPVFETIDLVRKSLPAQTSFIGFCGAPWTVASYMVAGHGTPDQAPARLAAYRDPVFFQALIDRLVKASIAYLSRQVEAGIEAVQIFDSWAGVLPKHEFERWCLVPVQQIIQGLKALHPNVPVIAFPRGAGGRIRELALSLGAEAIGLDTAVDPYWARDQIDAKVAVQGNLDPLVLLAGGSALDRAVDTILEAFSGRPHIFNLGHGILPPTPIAHVEQMLKRLHGN